MLEIQKIYAGYGADPVLKGVSATALSGQITAVIGPNGCGKSTLLKTLCGIVSARSGCVSLNGKALLSLPSQQLAQQVAYLPQSRQAPEITVERLVLHGRFPYLSYPRRYRQQDHQVAAAAIRQMDLQDLSPKNLTSLSGGQQQRAYLAMALAQQTNVILLDEPTTYMDISYQKQTLSLARELANSGKCVILVIHDLAAALQSADSILLLREGEVVIQGTPEQVYQSGALQRVFGLEIHRIQLGERWYYIVE